MKDMNQEACPCFTSVQYFKDIRVQAYCKNQKYPILASKSIYFLKHNHKENTLKSVLKPLTLLEVTDMPLDL
jgi:hypothetical protein